MEPITLHYSESLARDVVRAQSWQETGYSYIAAWLVSAGTLGFLLWSDNRSWLVGVFGVVVTLGAIFPVLHHFSRWRVARDKLRQLKKKEATLELFEAEMRVTSDAGTLRLAWGAIRGVWRFPQFWVVRLTAVQTFALPLADIPPEAQDFILSRIRAAGGKIG